MKSFRYFILLTLVAIAPSCASIVSRSVYPVDFNSEPQGAELTIESRDGYVVYTGRTPSTVYLESAAGYMRPELYKVTYRHNDREPVTTYLRAKLDGWYFGNLLLGGWIGMLLVDPLTGAMYRIPPRAEVISVSAEPSYRIPEVPVESAEPAQSSEPNQPAEEWSPLGEK